jgi:hypothetical protein
MSHNARTALAQTTRSPPYLHRPSTTTTTQTRIAGQANQRQKRKVAWPKPGRVSRLLILSSEKT